MVRLGRRAGFVPPSVVDAKRWFGSDTLEKCTPLQSSLSAKPSKGAISHANRTWMSSDATPEPSRTVRRGDILDVRIESLDYGGTGVGAVSASPNGAEENVGLTVLTPKGAAPGDIVRVAVRKIRRTTRPVSDSDEASGNGQAMPAEVVSSQNGKNAAGEAKSRTAKNTGPFISHVEGQFMERLRKSPDAVAPACRHFGNTYLGGGSCGGCSSMDIAYAQQIVQKEAQVRKMFEVLGSDAPKPSPFVLCDRLYNYRNKMEFSYGRKWYVGTERSKKAPMTADTSSTTDPGGENVSKRKDSDETTVKSAARHSTAEDARKDREYALGLHVPSRYDRIVQIDECFIQDPVGNDILEFIRQRVDELGLLPYDCVDHSGYIRNVCIRTARPKSGSLEIMVNFMTNPCEVPAMLVPLAEELRSRFPAVVCVVQNMPNGRAREAMDPSLQRLLAGPRPYIEQALQGLTFEISANSFFQTNPFQAERLYAEAIRMADLRADDVVVDLFCGTGSIGLSMAAHCRSVVGVEVVRDAVEDARRNARNNGITNAHFVHADLSKQGRELQQAVLGDVSPDVIVVDPPRAGLHKSVVKFLSECNARRLVYVSCNPKTQVQDLRLLLDLAPGRFTIDKIVPVDMFPHTPHIETVVSLSAR